MIGCSRCCATKGKKRAYPIYQPNKHKSGKRFELLGHSDRGRVPYVVTVEKHENVALIISARKAEPYEEKNMKNRFNFADAKPVGNKIKNAKIVKTFRLDMNVFLWLRREAERTGIPYQTLLNSKLRESMSLPDRVQTLACISHQISAAAADPGMFTALRSVGLLDILLSMPAGPSVARLVSMPIRAASLQNLVRNAG